VIPFQSKCGNWRSSSGGGRPRAVAVDLRPMRPIACTGRDASWWCRPSRA